MLMPDTVEQTPSNAPAAESGPEKRRSPRVAAGRPARVRIDGHDQELSVVCSIVDLSRDGCRVALPRKFLPPNWEWRAGLTCAMTIGIDAHKEVGLVGHLVWSQRTRDEFDILGFRFAESPPEAVFSIDRFIVVRLHAGLGIQETHTDAADRAPKALEVPLEAEGVFLEMPDAAPFRFLLHAVGGNRLLARYAPRPEESVRIPPEGATLNLAVFPPVWARGERRTLRFAARVTDADADGATLDFSGGENDLNQMIRALIPPKVVRKEKETEVDFRLVLLALAAVILGLIIASMQE